MGASAPAGLSRSRATISLCLAKPFAHGERPAQRNPEVVRDAEPVMQPHRRYAVANLCICACQPKREGAMTSEALFGLSILMNLVAWGIVALLFIWSRRLSFRVVRG